MPPGTCIQKLSPKPRPPGRGSPPPAASRPRVAPPAGRPPSRAVKSQAPAPWEPGGSPSLAPGPRPPGYPPAAPTQAIRSQIGGWLGPIFNARDRAQADQRLKDAVEHFTPTAPKLARWLEDNVPELLTVFTLPTEHRKKLRITNAIERPIQQELKRRPRNVRVFPNPDALLRLASVILVEIDDQWSTSPKRYITGKQNMTR